MVLNIHWEACCMTCSEKQCCRDTLIERSAWTYSMCPRPIDVSCAEIVFRLHRSICSKNNTHTQTKKTNTKSHIRQKVSESIAFWHTRATISQDSVFWNEMKPREITFVGVEKVFQALRKYLITTKLFSKGFHGCLKHHIRTLGRNSNTLRKSFNTVLWGSFDRTLGELCTNSRCSEKCKHSNTAEENESWGAAWIFEESQLSQAPFWRLSRHIQSLQLR